MQGIDSRIRRGPLARAKAVCALAGWPAVSAPAIERSPLSRGLIAACMGTLLFGGIFQCLVLLQFDVLGGATSGHGVEFTGHLFCGRPGTQPVEDFKSSSFEDFLLVAYAKAKLKSC
jgi:hypothetical protein